MMNLKKITEYLLYATVFFLPWQTLWIWRETYVGGFKGEYGVVGMYGIDVLIVLLLVVSLVEYRRNFNFEFRISNLKSILNALISKFRNSDLIQNSKFKIRNYRTLHLVSYILIGYVFLSIAWSPDKTLALYFSFKLLLAMGLFWAVRRIEFSWKKLLVTLLIAGALQGALAVGQFLTQDTFSSKWLGLSAHDAAQGGTSVLENASGRWLRAYGSFPHPNVLGGYLAIVLLLVIWYEIKRKKNFEFRILNFDSILNDIILKFKNYNLVQNSKLKIKNSYHILYYASIVLMFSGLIVSFSRSAWLVFVLGLGILFWTQKERRRGLVTMVLIFIGTTLIWLNAFSPLFLARTMGEERLEKKSVSDRVEYVTQAREIIQEHLWLGVGAGNYTQAVFEKNPQKKIWEIQPVHNVFLLIWAELGLVGLILWLGFLGSVFLVGYKESKIFTLVLYASYFILYALDHWLWTSHFGLFFFFLLLGLISWKKGFQC